jgi:hypothetical protein
MPRTGCCFVHANVPLSWPSNANEMMSFANWVKMEKIL